MEQEEASGLTNKLRLIQELKYKLLHVDWAREPFVLLSRILQDTREVIEKPQDECDVRTIQSITHLQTLLARHLRINELPRGSERIQLLDSLDELLINLDHSNNPNLTDSQDFRRVAGAAASIRPGGNILLVADSAMRALSIKLEHANFQVWHCQTPEDARAMLLGTELVGAIIDLDLESDSIPVIEVVKQLNARIAARVPIFFLSERSDFTARLQAVRAGGSGYFTKPVDSSALIEQLWEHLENASVHGQRVLIIDDDAETAAHFAQELHSKGIITHVINHPQRVIQAVHQLQPQLLILNLGLQLIDATDLVKLIQQHELCFNIPLLLLSTEETLPDNLTSLGIGENDVLVQPLSAEYLLTVVNHRLRQANSHYNRLNNLHSRDTMSNLYNRRYFLSLLEHALGNRQSDVAIMLIHLENLQATNNAAAGDTDKLVELAAQRLQQSLGPGYQASRFGDMIFAILAHNVSKSVLLTTARAVRSLLEAEPYAINSHSQRLYVSIGISCSEDSAHNVHSLISNADLAVSVARERDEEHIHLYNPTVDQQEATSYQQRLIEEISKAVARQNMSLVFQPIVSLRNETRNIERYEVLLRMRDQQDREIIPEVVFSSAQDLRLGMMLDRWVIAHCLPVLRQRHLAGLRTNLFINISPAILQDTTLLSWLQEGFSKAQIEPSSLIFELSESIVSENQSALQKLMIPLKRLGCRLSLDHFGNPTQASFKLLDELAKASLTVDYVKLDPTFVHDLVSDEDKQKKLSQLTNHLNQYNITTIVGCIEDSHTLYTLITCGIEYAQGYFLQRPQAEMSYDFAGLELENVVKLAAS